MVKSRDELAEWCLRRLGHPVIQINVTRDQIEDCIDEALQRYYEFHSDGSQLAYMAFKISDNDVKAGKIKIDNNIMAVTKSINIGGFGSFSSTAAGNLTNQMFITDLIAATSGNGVNMSNYYSEASFNSGGGAGQFYSKMSYLNSVSQMFNAERTLRFIKHGHFVRFVDTSVIKKDDVVVFECYLANTADEYNETYNDLWLKRYTTAMVKKQWANNLIKYNGFQLPSGLTIDGSTILSEANNDLEKLEEELRTTWEEPLLPIIG